jgi:hypothetical protein
MIAQERDVQVLLSTHSRHVIDALHRDANVLWARKGNIERVVDSSTLSILLDLGALDIKEQIRSGTSVCIVLTEDDRTASLKTILESSGFDMERTDIKSYSGCTSPHNLHPLIETIKEVNENAAIVVHGDRDYNTDQEIQNWQVQIRGMGAEPFTTKGVDIESHFLNSRHLAAVNKNLSEDAAQQLITLALSDTTQASVSHYVNGRCDIEKKARTFGSLDLGNLAAQATSVYDSDPLKYCHSKTVIARVRQLFHEQTGNNLESQKKSDFVASPELLAIAQRIFPKQLSSTSQ